MTLKLTPSTSIDTVQNTRDTLFILSVFACFFLSGAAALVYEIAWMRMLGLVFGHTVYALSTVLASFMAGLALGAFLFGRFIDRRGRPLRVYGLLEAGIAGYALLTPYLFELAQSLYLWLYRSFDLSLFTFSFSQFVLIFVILLVPTTLMGASLPVLAKLFVKNSEGLAQRVGDLYAVNTFGAVAGSAAAGFFLLPAIGVKFSIISAAACNLIIGIWSLLADRWILAARLSPVSPNAEFKAVQPEASSTDDSSLVIWLVLAGTGLSGAASMLYELAWTRALRLVIGSSIYAFSTMLTTFLIGLAMGSFLFARLGGRRSVNVAVFGWMEIAIGFTAIMLIPTFAWMPDLVLAIVKQTSSSTSGALLTQFALSFFAMIIPTTLMGAAFPCAAQICARSLPSLGRDVGQVYSANTLGTIVGSLMGGFLLVPSLGAQGSMTAAAIVNGAIGATLLFLSPPPQPVRTRAIIVFLIILLFAASIFFIPRWNRNVMVGGVSVYVQRFISAANPAALFRQNADSRQLLYYREGINSTIAVTRNDGTIALSVDGKADASNDIDMATQLMLGHLPLILHPRPERVLVIGLGSGVTAGAVAQHSVVREIDVVELEPAVAEASSFFVQENRGVLRDPRVRLVIADGRNHILATKKRYDVISSEPSNPWMAGVANLFSLEFYRLAEQRLADDGIMIQWVHGYNLFPREFKMIVNTFRHVFPHSTLWRTMHGDYLIVGKKSPLTLDYALLTERTGSSERIREDLGRLWLNSPLDLLTLFYLDEADLARFADGAPLNTDDRPLLEFSAPLALYTDTMELNSRLLRQNRRVEFPPVTNLPADLLEKRRLHFARLYWAIGEKEDSLKQLLSMPRHEPGDNSFALERAKLFLALGEFERANDELAGIASLRPGDRTITNYLKAANLLRQLRAEKELRDYSKTQYGLPNPAEALNNLGIVYTRLGVKSGEPTFFELAVDALEAGLRTEPQSYPILNNLGNAWFELGKFDQAAAAYREIIRVMPRRAEPHFNLGLVYEKQAKPDLASSEYETALTLNPDWSMPKTRLDRLRQKPSRLNP